jgi:hypothetical protein
MAAVVDDPHSSETKLNTQSKNRSDQESQHHLKLTTVVDVHSSLPSSPSHFAWNALSLNGIFFTCKKKPATLP